jgi:Leucine-rich repeat (LRR) protein
MLKKLVLYLSLFGLMSAANANDEYVANELIVKIADGANYSDIITLRESVNATVKKTIEQLNLEVWNIQDELGFIDLIQSNRNIEYAEPNYIQRAIGMPDDARFDDLWGMHNTGQSGGTTDADIDAVEVTGGRLNVNNALMSNPNFSCSQVTEIPSTECEALVALYNSTDGDNWTNNSGWLETNTPCSWYKVTCSSGHVSEIDLGWNGYSNNLTGSIPSELGNLSNLRALSLWGNSLTGSIPSELGNLSYLWHLNLGGNSLTGSIPSELGNLSNLNRLYLDSNQLCGEIPVELKNLSNIPSPDDCDYYSCLELDNNHLTATDSELIAWLDTYNPGWDETQTPCPQQCKLQLTSATYTITEDGGQATITVTRTDSSDGAVSVEYATSDETATNPDDYTQSTGTLYWSDSDTNDKTFPVEIIDDSQQENDETFIVSLGNPTGGAQLGTPDTAAVTITDNDSFSCKKVTEIPKKECNALVALYGSTDGENWVDNTGWKMTNTPCNWYGVTCKKGSVGKLELSNNNLKGVISKKFFKLKKLKVLFLNNNQLSGKLSNSMMKLKKLTELDLNVNCLKTKVSKKLKKWLDELNPGWDETQTNCLY